MVLLLMGVSFGTIIYGIYLGSQADDDDFY